jgi:hypothetical protein
MENENSLQHNLTPDNVLRMAFSPSSTPGIAETLMVCERQYVTSITTAIRISTSPLSAAIACRTFGLGSATSVDSARNYRGQ